MFPGGELEGERPKVLCSSCRASRADRTGSRPLCFQCYRVSLDRERALQAAGKLDTSSLERFQDGLPFEPVNRPRLEMLRAERVRSRSAMEGNAMEASAGRFVAKQRRAQIAARHALQRVAAANLVNCASPATRAERERALAAAIHAAQLQLPESWLPFVVSR